MSLSTDRRDDGFTLLEVVVALGVIAIVTAALVPQLIAGIKSAGLASSVTQAKGVAQGQLEQMRNLPYHVAPAAGAHIDVLDRFYSDLQAPASSPVCASGDRYAEPTAAWGGYVAAGEARCDYEPRSGPFYRTVTPAAEASTEGRFVVVTDTQFLSTGTPPTPVTPRAGYDSTADGHRTPPASQIGVTVTVLYGQGAGLRAVSTYTQIAETFRSPTRIQGEAHATAVQFGSMTADIEPQTLSLTAGLVNITGSLSRASSVSTNLAGVTASTSAGGQVSGASRSLVAPPTQSILTETTELAGQLPEGCGYACWDSTSLGPIAASASGGLPTAGSATAPLQARLTQRDAHHGFTFGNTAAGAATYRAELDLTGPLVRLSIDAAPTSTPGCGVIAGSYVTGGGLLTSTPADEGTGVVGSCAAVASAAISLFPTTFAPDGVVRIRLDSAMASCQVSGSTHTPSTSYSYSAVVEYYDGQGYVATPVTAGMATDPLEALLQTNPAVTADGSKRLGHYIDSWSALTADKVTDKEIDGVAEVSLPGVVTINSKPVRDSSAERPASESADGLDPTSVVSLTVGAVGCSAEDAR